MADKGEYSLKNNLQVKAIVTPLKNPTWLSGSINHESIKIMIKYVLFAIQSLDVVIFKLLVFSCMNNLDGNVIISFHFSSLAFHICETKL